MDILCLTDEQLIVKVREENKELYSEIIHRYEFKLSHYLRKFIRNNDELADVLQDVFIKTYKNLYWFDESRKFSPWIYRITRNEALNYIRKNSKFVISLDQEELGLVDKRDDIKDLIDNNIAKEKIEKGLSLLKEKYREPFILYFFEEKTYEEISEILRIPKNTIGVLIMRAKKLLKEILQKKLYDK